MHFSINDRFLITLCFSFLIFSAYILYIIFFRKHTLYTNSKKISMGAIWRCVYVGTLEQWNILDL